MRMLRDNELDLVSGGQRRGRVWTFESPTVTIVDRPGAVADLKSNMLSGAIGGGLSAGIGGAILGALGGGVVSMNDIRTHVQRLTPNISVEECLPPSLRDGDSDC